MARPNQLPPHPPLACESDHISSKLQTSLPKLWLCLLSSPHPLASSLPLTPHPLKRLRVSLANTMVCKQTPPPFTHTQLFSLSTNTHCQEERRTLPAWKYLLLPFPFLPFPIFGVAEGREPPIVEHHLVTCQEAPQSLQLLSGLDVAASEVRPFHKMGSFISLTL